MIILIVLINLNFIVAGTVYINANGQKIAQEVDGEMQYIYNDHLGSPRVIVDSDGKIVWKADYQVFGEVFNEKGDSEINYNSKEEDVDTGLLYYGARYYDPEIGRFISADSVEVDPNAFVYTANNPLKYVDPDGRQIKDALLKPIRKMAYRMGSRHEGPKRSIGEIFRALFTIGGYTGLKRMQGDSKNSPPNMLAMYLKLEPIILPKSKYKPTSLTKYKDLPLYSIKEYFSVKPFDSSWSSLGLLKRISQMEKGEIIKIKQVDDDQMMIDSDIDLVHFTLSVGKDEKGPYLSLFDVWDFGGKYNEMWNLKGLEKIQSWAMNKVGEPIGIYDRYYLDENKLNERLEELGPDFFMGFEDRYYGKDEK